MIPKLQIVGVGVSFGDTKIKISFDVDSAVDKFDRKS